MTKDEFIRRVIGVPWANRACSFEKVDCWGLVVLYYRHVLGIELHQTPDYEAGADFFTCYQGDVVFWRQVDKPIEGGIFVGYRGAQPAHVGSVLNRKAIHARGGKRKRERGFIAGNSAGIHQSGVFFLWRWLRYRIFENA